MAKRRKSSIRTKLFICMIVFTALSILTVWMTQNLFLEPIYRSKKVSEIKSAVHEILASTDSEDFASEVKSTAKKYGVCVIVDSPHREFERISVDVVTNDCVIHRESARVISELYAKAMNNEQPTLYLSEFGRDDVAILTAKATHNGYPIIILLNSVIVPVGATLDTMNTMLIYVTLIMILLSLVLTLILSRMITKPIISITKGARALAEGDYAHTFKGGGSSEIAQLADTLNYAKDELQKTDLLQKELIANISHDIRTPLTMISGYSQIMRDIPEENTPENLQIIIDETERLSTLVTDVLDLSKLRAGTKKMTREPLDLSSLAKETLSRFDKMTERCKLSYEGKDEVIVDADKTGVLQVIYNLVANAVNHTPKTGNVTVSVMRIGDYGRLCVADNGEGIPAENLKDIWERYYKADSTVRPTGSSGLGLSIVKEIMLRHSGYYGVSSTVGEGSLFWVDFPLSDDIAKNDIL